MSKSLLRKTFERPCAVANRPADDDVGTWTHGWLLLTVYGGLNHKVGRGFEAHLKEGRAAISHADPVHRLVSTIKGHVVGNQGQVSRIDFDTVNGENTTDLVDDAHSGGFNAVCTFNRPYVIRQEAVVIDVIQDPHLLKVDSRSL